MTRDLNLSENMTSRINLAEEFGGGGSFLLQIKKQNLYERCWRSSN